MNILKRSVIALCLTAVLVSCDSNNNNNDNDINLPGFLGQMSATINGVNWNALSATSTGVTGGAIPAIVVAGADATGAGIGLGWADVDNTGTFEFGSSNVTTMQWTPNASSGTYIATSGTSTISVFTTENVQGTFSFVATRASDGATVSVTNGTFNVGNGISPF